MMSSLQRLAILLALVAISFGAPLDDVVSPSPYPDDGEDYRLDNKTIIPINYNITLHPYLLESDPNRFTFDGVVNIEIEVLNATKQIILHSKNLNYSVTQYWPKGAEDEKATLNCTAYNNVTEKMTYNTVTQLTIGTYILHFEYKGNMDNDMYGFYRSSYVDSNNVTKWIGSTQFQTKHARRAFPSFDEPKFKATFNITLRRHKSMNSVSNTKILKQRTDGDYVFDVYERTPNMSTYLVAFIISEFTERNNSNFSILARPEYYNQSEYSFEVGQRILNDLDSYLNKSYYTMGIDKMHMAAIPDFSAGAMENWGLLTFRERALLYVENYTTLSAKQSIASIIAHEQAHMWFGDLVTCDWWSYAWLNEGFARYFQYFSTARVERFETDKQFVVDQVQSVMNMDSTNSTNPMSDENTNSPADLSRMFNSITYNKGAAFIRMINHVIGEANFQKSLQTYLDAHQYSNTVPQNLLDHWLANWPANTKAHASEIFYSFTTQVGYPLVTISVASDGHSFEISQKRFLLNSNDGSNSQLLYTIPITYTTDVEKNFVSTTPKFILEANNTKTNVKLLHKVNWVIANIQEVGYYRVNYDEHTWHKIHAALAADNLHSGIHEFNRAQIIDDLFNLARAGVIDYDLAMPILEYLSIETHYVPWSAAFNGYNYLSIRLGNDIEKFSQYILQLTNKVYKELGFNENARDDSLTIYNRAKVLTWSCKYGNTDCIAKAQALFAKMDTDQIPPNISSAVYCTVMRQGKATDFEKLFNRYNTSAVATEKTLILGALGCVKEKSLIERYFWAIVGDDVRRQDKSSALSSLYTENNENVTPVFTLVTEHCDELADAMGGYSSVASVIANIAARFTEESQKKQLEDFNAANSTKFDSAASTLKAAEKTVAENLEWANNRLGTFKNYLEKRGNGSATLTAFTLLTLLLIALMSKVLS